MPKRWTLTKESFDTLLTWLDPDRELAGRKYEDIRHSLVKIFTWRGVHDAEGLADETINRVAEKIQELKADYLGDPALYFYGVAKKLLLEYSRTVQQQVPLPEELAAPSLPTDAPDAESATSERMLECLEACLEELSTENREILVSYYSKERQAKIDFRKELAEELGVSVNHLRVRVHRIRASLHECITRCLGRKLQR